MESIISMTLNQDGTCLAVGTTRGFRIYNISPFRETFRRNLGFHEQHKGHEDDDLDVHVQHSKDYGNDDPDATTMNHKNHDNNHNTIHNNNNKQGGGIGIVEMLFRCNLLCLVGGGPNPQFPLNKVMIYDDHQSKCIGELSFRQRVVCVKLRRDRIAAATASKVYLYNFADLSLLDQIHTIANPLGIMALSPGSGAVLACPSIVSGHVRLELYSTRKSILVEAHEANLAAITLSVDGNVLATASVKGTVIRVFDTQSGTKLHELRRGTERASIACLCFRNPDNAWLATCSDKGTVHIFHLKNKQQEEEAEMMMASSSPTAGGGASRRRLSTSSSHDENQHNNNNTNNSPPSSLQSTSKSIHKFGSRMLKSVIKKNAYLSSEWSHSQVRGLADPKLCTFLPENRLAVIGADGSFWVVDYSKGGEAESLVYHSFLNDEEDELRVDVAGTNDVNEDGFVSISE